jgi:5-methylcytosine-specific restriction protein A
MKHARLRGDAWMKRRRAILAREPLCRMCLSKGRVTPPDEIDHITPLHKGGSNALDNLQPLCKACHEDKTAADMGRAPRVTIGVDGYPVQEDA